MCFETGFLACEPYKAVASPTLTFRYNTYLYSTLTIPHIPFSTITCFSANCAQIVTWIMLSILTWDIFIILFLAFWHFVPFNIPILYHYNCEGFMRYKIFTSLLCRLLHCAWNTENCDCARLEHFLEAEPFKAKRSIRSQQPIHHTMSAFDAFVTVHQYQLSAIPEELWQVMLLHYWRVRIGADRLTPNILHV